MENTYTSTLEKTNLTFAFRNSANAPEK